MHQLALSAAARLAEEAVAVAVAAVAQVGMVTSGGSRAAPTGPQPQVVAAPVLQVETAAVLCLVLEILAQLVPMVAAVEGVEEAVEVEVSQ